MGKNSNKAKRAKKAKQSQEASTRLQRSARDVEGGEGRAELSAKKGALMGDDELSDRVRAQELAAQRAKELRLAQERELALLTESIDRYQSLQDQLNQNVGDLSTKVADSALSLSAIEQELDDIKDRAHSAMREQLESSLQECQHIIHSTASLDPKTWRAVATTISQRLSLYREALADDGPPIDELNLFCLYLSSAIREVIRRPKTQIKRSHVMTPVHKLREIDTRCVEWLSRVPGRTAREKASVRGKVLGVKRYLSAQIKANEVALYLIKQLRPLISDRFEAYRARGFMDRLDDSSSRALLKVNEAYRSIFTELRRSELSEVEARRHAEPNNTLLNDRFYGLIWRARAIPKRWSIYREFNRERAQRRASESLFWAVASQIQLLDNVILLEGWSRHRGPTGLRPALTVDAQPRGRNHETQWGYRSKISPDSDSKELAFLIRPDPLPPSKRDPRPVDLIKLSLHTAAAASAIAITDDYELIMGLEQELREQQTGYYFSLGQYKGDETLAQFNYYIEIGPTLRLNSEEPAYRQLRVFERDETVAAEELLDFRGTLSRRGIEEASAEIINAVFGVTINAAPAMLNRSAVITTGLTSVHSSTPGDKRAPKPLPLRPHVARIYAADAEKRDLERYQALSSQIKLNSEIMISSENLFNHWDEERGSLESLGAWGRDLSELLVRRRGAKLKSLTLAVSDHLSSRELSGLKSALSSRAADRVTLIPRSVAAARFVESRGRTSSELLVVDLSVHPLSITSLSYEDRPADFNPHRDKLWRKLFTQATTETHYDLSDSTALTRALEEDISELTKWASETSVTQAKYLGDLTTRDPDTVLLTEVKGCPDVWSQEPLPESKKITEVLRERDQDLIKFLGEQAELKPSVQVALISERESQLTDTLTKKFRLKRAPLRISPAALNDGTRLIAEDITRFGYGWVEWEPALFIELGTWSKTGVEPIQLSGELRLEGGRSQAAPSKLSEVTARCHLTNQRSFICFDQRMKVRRALPEVISFNLPASPPPEAVVTFSTEYVNGEYKISMNLRGESGLTGSSWRDAVNVTGRWRKPALRTSLESLSLRVRSTRQNAKFKSAIGHELLDEIVDYDGEPWWVSKKLRGVTNALSAAIYGDPTKLDQYVPKSVIAALASIEFRGFIHHQVEPAIRLSRGYFALEREPGLELYLSAREQLLRSIKQKRLSKNRQQHRADLFVSLVGVAEHEDGQSLAKLIYTVSKIPMLYTNNPLYNEFLDSLKYVAIMKREIAGEIFTDALLDRVLIMILGSIERLRDTVEDHYESNKNETFYTTPLARTLDIIGLFVFNIDNTKLSDRQITSLLEICSNIKSLALLFRQKNLHVKCEWFDDLNPDRLGVTLFDLDT